MLDTIKCLKCSGSNAVLLKDSIVVLPNSLQTNFKCPICGHISLYSYSNPTGVCSLGFKPETKEVKIDSKVKITPKSAIQILLRDRDNPDLKEAMPFLCGILKCEESSEAFVTRCHCISMFIKKWIHADADEIRYLLKNVR